MRPAPFPYSGADYESIPCNLCGGTAAEVVETRDRNGLAVNTCLCTHCGLLYLNPRMTARWYAQYYQQEYRAQMARFRGRPVAAPDHAALFRSARRHGEALATRFRSFWKPGLTVEVGSSVGGVLDGIRQVCGVDVVGIEPSADEAAFATSQGVPSHATSIETFAAPLPQAAVVVCTQSLNHFLDPRRFLTWSHEHLEPGGLLVLEVMNFRHVLRHFGWMPRAVQIDHTYMFVPEVLDAFVQAAGFEVLCAESSEQRSAAEQKSDRQAGLPAFHIGVVARKTDRPPFADPAAVPQLSTRVKQSLDAARGSRLRYWLRFGFRKWLKTGRA